MKFFRERQAPQRIQEEDSQEESIFHVDVHGAKSKAIHKFSLGKRLIGRNHHWDRVQTTRYLDFLKENFGFLQGRVPGEHTALYDLMSHYIKGKSYAECRIHHSRQLSKYGTLEKIIQAIEKRIRGISSSKNSYRYGLQVCLEEESCHVQQETEDLWDVLEQDVPQSNSTATFEFDFL